MTGFADTYLRETSDIVAALDADMIEKMVRGLARVRLGGGRLFILGVGGSAGHAGHAVNDFRKICGFEAYAPTDNVAELTARANDEGWDTVFSEWLKGSRLDGDDAILIFSVGGGNEDKGVSVNIVRAIDLARQLEASVTGFLIICWWLYPIPGAPHMDEGWYDFANNPSPRIGGRLGGG